MATQIGSKGLINADLVLVQEVSFSCSFIHEDSEGNPIDHTGWSKWCRIEGRSDYDLTGNVAFGEDGAIDLSIPDTLTAEIPTGTYRWDLIVEDELGYSTRIAYGSVSVYDSYARDAS